MLKDGASIIRLTIFKAAKLLMQFDTGVASDTAFKAIFQIFKLYIPDRLFKYQSLGLDSSIDKLRFETLRNNRIYTSLIQDLNDPFDSYCYFYNADEIGRNLGIENSEVDDIFGIFRKSRVASLTSVGEQSMPMWAHYANNHRGFCVEYDTANQNNTLFKSFLFPVQYSEKRIDLISFLLKKAQEEVARAILEFNDSKQEVRINDKAFIYSSFVGKYKTPVLELRKRASLHYSRKLTDSTVYRCCSCGNLCGNALWGKRSDNALKDL